MKAIIVNRCSTDETKQDVELQTKPCVEYCQKQNWDYNVVAYYGSASKKIPDELEKVLDAITRREYQAIIVFSMDRFGGCLRASQRSCSNIIQTANADLFLLRKTLTTIRSIPI